MANADTHTETESEIEVAYPKQYNVVLHNDNRTTFEFVIELLITLFKKSEVEAMHITATIHTKGKGIAGCYTKDVAEIKAHEGMHAAQLYGFPLLLTVEAED